MVIKVMFITTKLYKKQATKSRMLLHRASTNAYYLTRRPETRTDNNRENSTTTATTSKVYARCFSLNSLLLHLGIDLWSWFYVKLGQPQVVVYFLVRFFHSIVERWASNTSLRAWRNSWQRRTSTSHSPKSWVFAYRVYLAQALLRKAIIGRVGRKKTPDAISDL